MSSSSILSVGGVQITQCPVLFNGTNYRDWVPRLRWHMRGLRLWEFITGDISCPSLVVPVSLLFLIKLLMM